MSVGVETGGRAWRSRSVFLTMLATVFATVLVKHPRVGVGVVLGRCRGY